MKSKLKVFSKTKFLKDIKRAEKKIKFEEDKAWQIAVKTRDNYTCQICGNKVNDKPQSMHAAHIFPYEYELTRCDINNGVALCPACHIYKKYSFHQNPLFFIEWFKKNKPLQYEYLINILPKFLEDNKLSI